MGEDNRYCDPSRESYEHHRDPHRHKETSDTCYDHNENDWDWGSWLPIIIIVFILCGGFGWFTGTNKDDCYESSGSGSWILIVLVIFLLWQGQGDGKKGGFLSGLF
ncbi:MAG: hypothetical protein PHR60_01225 [Eubacteriales bacterium]|nr:hypothetical protein [Eubacteriales bacterium]MDD4582792.1 hypothetical protein [Eubacteriales bacterium]